MASLLCAACTGKSEFSLPWQDEPIPEFSRQGEVPRQQRWWEAFEDPQLDAHIETALDGNFTLAAAWYRRRAAQALARREASGLFPHVELRAFAERAVEDEGQSRQRYRFGPQAAYEVDLWGRIGANVAAERQRALAAAADYQAAALSLSADVALTWYRLCEARYQLDLLRRQIETNQDVLVVLKARFGAALVRSADILRQRLLIQALEEDAIARQADKALLAHQLSLLMGQAPQQARFSCGAGLPVLPAMPETGLPMALLERRPDVRQAYQGVKAADQDLAAAIASQYPRFSLSAAYLSEADRASALFSQWFTVFSAALVAPLVDGGLRDAEIDRGEAVRGQRIEEYGQVALNAFREVEDALVRERSRRERLDNLDMRVSLASQSYQQLRSGYLNGANGYIDVLSALSEMQQTQTDRLLQRRLLLEARIGLYRALAGPLNGSPGARPSQDAKGETE